MKEEWKDIPGFEGIAKASSLGRIYKCNNQKIYESNSSVNDYTRCRLYKCGKCYEKYIHQWVAITFIPNPENKPTVNHKDGHKWNNSVSNLEWNTYKENNDHAIRMGLSSYHKLNNDIQRKKAAMLCRLNAEKIKKPVVVMNKNREYINTFASVDDAAKYIGVSSSGVTRCCKGEYKYTGGYITMFKEDYYETIH